MAGFYFYNAAGAGADNRPGSDTFPVVIDSGIDVALDSDDGALAWFSVSGSLHYDAMYMEYVASGNDAIVSAFGYRNGAGAVLDVSNVGLFVQDALSDSPLWDADGLYAGDDVFSGNSFGDAWYAGLGNDALAGNDGNDSLNGQAGEDTLRGGAGDDALGGNAGSDELNGNDGDDSLTGGAGDDYLDGGPGGDLLSGGAGNDSYIVDDVLDQVIESAGGGNDVVSSSVSFTLGAGVEGLGLTGTATAGIGNAVLNLLLGNELANRLSGRAGPDRLEGRAGNDLLVGGSENDTLIGGIGNDILQGQGGADSLAGGAGRDAFLFSTPLGAGEVDEIADFARGIDRLRLDDDVFTAFDATAGNQLGAAQFHKAAGAVAAHDADDRIVYNTTTGALYYDADGIGGVAAVQFAKLDSRPHPGITEADFRIVG